MTETAVSLRFQVRIDRFGSLGLWTKCEGIGVEYDVFEYREGGQNGYTHRLPGRAKYANLKLSRPIDANSAKVAEWMASLQREATRETAEISVLDPTGAVVATWNLTGVFPARWTGPTLDVAGNQIALETLELAHNGFIGGS
jgi:phage tail-like protein